MATMLRIPPDRTVNPNRIQKIKPLSMVEDAYRWILEMIEGRNVQKIKLYGLHGMVFNYSTHVSFYHSDGKPAYMRVYWPQEGKVKYYEVEDYEELYKKDAEITKLLLRNGEYAFLQANDPFKCFDIYRTT